MEKGSKTSRLGNSSGHIMRKFYFGFGTVKSGKSPTRMLGSTEVVNVSNNTLRGCTRENVRIPTKRSVVPLIRKTFIYVCANVGLG